MQLITKILNLKNVNIILPLIGSSLNKKLIFANTMLQRFYSKRYTYCDNCIINRKCNKPRNKMRKTAAKSTSTDKISLGDTTMKRKSVKKPKEKPSCRSKACKPGMKNKCDGSEFAPSCSLTPRYGQWTTNECSNRDKTEQREIPCPRGDWWKPR